jgi:Putative transposase
MDQDGRLVDPRVWNKEWVIDLEAVASGEPAFKYLAPYIFRVAISNNRIVKLEDGKVIFRYKDSATHQIKTSTLSPERFIARFLQHVLPPNFVKVRYYGLMSGRNRELLKAARRSLSAAPINTAVERDDHNQPPPREPPRCRKCGGEMTLVEQLRAKGGGRRL